MNIKSLNLADYSLPSLEAACRRETEAHRRGKRSDGQYCLEIIRRALVRMTTSGDSQFKWGDHEAQEVFTRIYSEFIKAQINRRALYDAASFDEIVQDAWLRFWQAAAGSRDLSFPTLGAALSYLQRTAMSALIVHRRRWRDTQRQLSLEQLVSESGDAMLPHDAEDPFSDVTKARFQERIRELLNDLEYRIFALRYHGQLRPQAIAALLREQGVIINNHEPTADSVSNVLERIFKRLEDDPELRDLLQAD
jgi:DNA-directed RNA polymerase specialized sigma24 family protein